MSQNTSNSSTRELRPGRLEGKVALLVGSGSGIGEATAHLFAGEGAMVMLADIRSDAIQRGAQAINAKGYTAAHCEVDVCSDESVKALVAATLDRYGRLDILFNSAGGSLSQDAPVHEVDLGVWDKTIPLDLLGTVLCARFDRQHVVGRGVARVRACTHLRSRQRRSVGTDPFHGGSLRKKQYSGQCHLLRADQY